MKADALHRSRVPFQRARLVITPAPEIVPLKAARIVFALDPLVYRHEIVALADLMTLPKLGGLPDVIDIAIEPQVALQRAFSLLSFILQLLGTRSERLPKISGKLNPGADSGNDDKKEDGQEHCGSLMVAHPLEAVFPGGDRPRPDRLLSQEALQIFGQLQGAVITCLRRLAQTFVTNRLQVARHLGRQAAQRDRLCG